MYMGLNEVYVYVINFGGFLTVASFLFFFTIPILLPIHTRTHLYCFNLLFPKLADGEDCGDGEFMVSCLPTVPMFFWSNYGEYQ